MAAMNFKHLHYFWWVAKAGGVARASEKLHLTPQTISGQIGLLEDDLGAPLFAKSGRNLELTDAGQLAFGYAQDIFALGSELEESLRNYPAGGRPVEFRVGVADAVQKAV
ncbi:MAG: LysR family transcriptional regulator, partial [Burkholderiales bacterium]|nr:LysR family transcriptional regulator [Burkholderiales bacterium]